MSEDLKLPYQDIGAGAPRSVIRDNASTGRHTYFVEFKKLQVRDGFNVRKTYTGIEELAEKIKANGLTPLTVDLIQTKKAVIAFIEQGHRRHKALSLLHEKGQLKSLSVPGIRNGEVECFVNMTNITELDRIKRLLSSNDYEPLTPEEQSAVAIRLSEVYKWDNVKIAKELGVSRQTVDNMILIGKQPEDVKDAIKTAVDKGVTTTTAAVGLVRSVKDPEKIKGKLDEAISTGDKIKVADVDKTVAKRKEEKAEMEEPKEATPASPIIVAAYKDDKEFVATSPKTPSHPKDFSKTKDPLDNVKDEETYITDIEKALDKIEVITDKGLNDQAGKDVSTNMKFIRQRLATIREFIQKAEIR